MTFEVTTMTDTAHPSAPPPRPRARRTPPHRRGGKRRGMTLVYVAGGIVLFLGAAALAVDMGHLYSRKAQAQRAADAAALAGAYALSTNAGKSDAIDLATAKAREYAALPTNGKYVNGTADGTKVLVTTPYNNYSTQIRVTVIRPEMLFFARVFFLRSSVISASSVAAYELSVDIPIAQGDYGRNGGTKVTYSVYGPYAYRSNGDPISVKFLADGSPNPAYTGKGYAFTLNVPYDYKDIQGGKKLSVDIFDPDCYNSNNQEDASKDGVDEIRDGFAGRTQDKTTTNYQLWMDVDGNPNNPDPADHIPVATSTYGTDPRTDMRWVTPPGFEFDLNETRFAGRTANSKFRIQVISTDGSSENGFNLRAGPPVPDGLVQGLDAKSDIGGGLGEQWNLDENAWHTYIGSGDNNLQYNGIKVVNKTSVAAQGNLPMNFNADGVADINLGNVPAAAAGGKLSIAKFDNDVGVLSNSVYYTCEPDPAVSGSGLTGTFAGTLSGNDTSTTDVIPLPNTYKGGIWVAHYDGESNDTSSWKVSYDRGSGVPSGIKLIS